MKPTMIRIGNFFFRHRNRLFPLIMIAFFAINPPSHDGIQGVMGAATKDWLAVTIALSGLALRGLVIGYAYIKRGGLNKKVYAEHLVTQGMFGLCRNPLYVGNILIYVGVFLLHGDPLVALSGIAGFLFIYQCIVYAEEAYLEDKFGDGYRAYCQDVARWIPNIGKFSEATEGMRFNLRRAIMKDYSTIATTLVMLTLTAMYKYLSIDEAGVDDRPMLLLAGAILAIGVWAGSVRYIKKRVVPQRA